MPTTLAVQFPLGRYHATSWDRSVNEGDVEWPPSPWRLLRALVATWYARWPDLPASEIDALLAALADPPSYLTPPTVAGHTRHYLPDATHITGATGNTGLTLDPYLRLPHQAELLIQWPVDLAPGGRATLAKLTEQLPYLGRADAVCHARLRDDDPTVDEAWWRPAGVADAAATRLLGVRSPVARAALEVTTVQVRRARRTIPQGATWVPYLAPREAEPPPSPAPAAKRTVEAVRFAVETTAPFRTQHGVLLADAVHHWFARRQRLDSQLVLGRAGAATNHRHAHFVPIADDNEVIHSLVMWVPGRLTPSEASEVVGITGRELNRSPYPGSQPVRGFPPTQLLVQAVGAIADVAPELCGPAHVWRSVTPYLPVRHRKRRETITEFLAADVARELSHRDRPLSCTVTPIEPGDRLTDSWALDFRRYRLRENMGDARVGLGIRLEFPEPAAGPLLLGRLTHFGFGAFVPEQAQRHDG